MLSAKYAEGSLHFNPAQGYQALDLTGSYNQGLNGVQQSFKTYAGRQYTVTFSVGHADRALYLPDSLVQVVVNGTPIGTADNAAVTPDMINWQVFSYRFTATGRAAVIGFYNASTASDYVGLDAVSVTIVPKPAPDDLARGMRR